MTITTTDLTSNITTTPTARAHGESMSIWSDVHGYDLYFLSRGG